ncbi:MAG: 3-dehydroquinate synthase [Anaerolineales bacterium]
MPAEYNLIITGFMGVGKTTVGQHIAAQLGRPFVDTDDIISERLGKNVPDIFAAYGEPFFRALEASIAREFATPQGLVIATGGGTLTNYENMRAISGPGNVIFCLNAPLDDIFARLEKDTRRRPMIDQQGDPRAAAQALLAQRQPLYARIRRHIDTGGRRVEDIAAEIIEIYNAEVARNAIRLPVHTPTNYYHIYIENGIMGQMPELLAAHALDGRRTLVVTNLTLAPLYGEQMAAALPHAQLITIPDGEQYKSIPIAEQLYKDFAAAGLDRNGVVIALGGGVVGDTVGYAAATYMRGVDVVQVPTSLLAMVDSSVGGKVAVDMPEGKNLVGAFKQPELVVVDPDVLGTLPPAEVRAGLAEAIKHGLLADPGLLDEIEGIAVGDAGLLRRAVQVKVDVVERDPYESGERAHLNLGHTFAHAIERLSNFQWRHGEAVGVGLVAAARLSMHLGRLAEDQAEYIEKIVEKVGLPTRINGFDPGHMWEAMQLDKKWRDGESHFVLLDGIGAPCLVRGVPREAVTTILEDMRS